MHQVPSPKENFLEARGLLSRFAPFFSTLLLWAPEIWTKAIPVAATDGKRLLMNQEGIAGMSREQIAAVLCHEVLHMALQHVKRRGNREPLLWNIACDISVNGMIRAEMEVNKFLSLPEGAVEDPKICHLSPEEIYELIKQNCPYQLFMADLTTQEPDEQDQQAKDRLNNSQDDPPNVNWEAALKEAGLRAGSNSTMLRRIAKATERKTNWREILRDFLSPNAGDFGGFDRRFLHQELYIDALEDHFDPNDLVTHIAIDTSGSIGDEILAKFLGEIQQIATLFPTLKVTLWAADAELYGPFTLENFKPIGGGGTDFRPFFQKVGRHDLAIYLTDGDGTFPKAAHPKTVWAICPGGVAEESIPFGKVTRIID